MASNKTSLESFETKFRMFDEAYFFSGLWIASASFSSFLYGYFIFFSLNNELNSAENVGNTASFRLRYKQ